MRERGPHGGTRAARGDPSHRPLQSPELAPHVACEPHLCMSGGVAHTSGAAGVESARRRRRPPGDFGAQETRIQALQTPLQYLLLSAPPEQEEAFQKLKLQHGSDFCFHGSPPANWHCILRQGLKNASGTSLMTSGQAHGPGIYLARDSSTSAGYSGRECRRGGNPPPGPAMEREVTGERLHDPDSFSMLAICEVAQVPSLKKCGNVWVCRQEAAPRTSGGPGFGWRLESRMPRRAPSATVAKRFGHRRRMAVSAAELLRQRRRRRAREKGSQRRPPPSAPPERGGDAHSGVTWGSCSASPEGRGCRGCARAAAVVRPVLVRAGPSRAPLRTQALCSCGWRRGVYCPSGTGGCCAIPLACFPAWLSGRPLALRGQVEQPPRRCRARTVDRGSRGIRLYPGDRPGKLQTTLLPARATRSVVSVKRSTCKMTVCMSSLVVFNVGAQCNFYSGIGNPVTRSRSGCLGMG